MKIKFLGSGSAFVSAKENYQSNILIEWLEEVKIREKDENIIRVEKQSRRLLYDAGMTIPMALEDAGLTPNDLHAVFISHLHADHAGGVEYLAFKTYFSSYPFGKNKKLLIGNNFVLDEGWDYTWKGGLRSIQNQRNTLETYFDTMYLKQNEKFKIFGKQFEPIQTVHIVDDRAIVPSYGLRFKGGKKKVFITGDTQFSPNQLLSFYQSVDVIFHDCEFANYPNSVHAQFHELCKLPENIKKKMYLYHYMLGDKKYVEVEKEVLNNGFAGLVKRGQEFEV